ncbi:hypothetical protein BpHYR1_014552 [Brachionus plicatilis]|uniref:Uncharacterized protein n=1 Tax=Brachionus plicatilis TaxID=10195 RepID=A0A3M7PTV1_BRAPC|nr:hypothetical protein BpHYR1_014552 [Brachionus plicatilis]
MLLSFELTTYSIDSRTKTCEFKLFLLSNYLKQQLKLGTLIFFENLRPERVSCLRPIDQNIAADQILSAKF